MLWPGAGVRGNARAFSPPAEYYRRRPPEWNSQPPVSVYGAKTPLPGCRQRPRPVSPSSTNSLQVPQVAPAERNCPRSEPRRPNPPHDGGSSSQSLSPGQAITTAGSSAGISRSLRRRSSLRFRRRPIDSTIPRPASAPQTREGRGLDRPSMLEAAGSGYSSDRTSAARTRRRRSLNFAFRKSRFIMAMKSMLMPLGQASSHSPWLVQEPK